MTKSEFVQRVAIALAGNPKFTMLGTISYVSIQQSADRLADHLEDNSDYCDFDEP